jgi:hypothetical protein
MKQSEIDRELRLLAKAEARARRWKSIGTTQYWTMGPLFFALIVSAGAKEGSFHTWLRFKWLDLDRVLWKVLGMSSNEHEPFSLHANGAFVITGWEIQSSIVRELDWQPGVLTHQLQVAAQNAASRSQEIALHVDSLDSYVQFLHVEHKAFMMRYPRAAVNVWKETLLVAMIRGDKDAAAEIARERIAARDSGAFSADGQTFYERALALNTK